MDLLKFCSNRIKHKTLSGDIALDDGKEKLAPESNFDVLLSIRESPREIKQSSNEFVNLGINIDYLEEIIDLGGYKDDDKMKSLTLQDVYERFILPLTESSGQSFCEFLQNQDKHNVDSIGKPSHLLITSLEEPYIKTIERLQSYFSSVNSNSNNQLSFTWISIFSDRQPIDSSSQTSEISIMCNSKLKQNSLKAIPYILWAPGFSTEGVAIETSLNHRESMILLDQATESKTHKIIVLTSAADEAHIDSILYSNSNNFKCIEKALCHVASDDDGENQNSIIDLVLKEWLFNFTPTKLQHQLKIKSEMNPSDEDANNISISKLRKIIPQQYALQEGDHPIIESLLNSRYDSNQTQLPLHEPERISSLNDIAYFYRSRGQYSIAEPYFQERWEYRKQMLREDHYHTLSAQRDLANIYRLQGKFESAEELLISCLQAQLVTLGSDHTETRITIKDIANLYESTGQLDLRQQLLSGQYQEAIQSFGVTHSKAVTAQMEVADGYLISQQYSEAAEIYQQCFGLLQQNIGDDHADTLNTLKLASAYRLQGKNNDAANALEKFIKINSQKSGESDQRTLYAEASLASAYSQVGRSEDAVDTYSQILQSTLILKEESVSIKIGSAKFSASCCRALAVEYMAQNNLQKAKYHLSVGYQICRDCSSGSNSKDLSIVWLTIAQDLSYLYTLLGDKASSADTLASIIPTMKALLGSQHRTILQLVLKTAECYRKVATVVAYETARPMYDECLHALKDNGHPEWNAEDQEILISTNLGLARLHMAQGNSSNAQLLLIEILTNEKNNKDSSTEKMMGHLQDTRQELTSVYISSGQYESAKVLLEKCLNIAQTINSNINSVLRVSHNLARVYIQLGQCGKAEQLYCECLSSSRETWGATHSTTVQLTYSLIDFYRLECNSSEGCQCHYQVLNKIDLLYRVLLEIFKLECDEDSIIYTLRHLINLHTSDPATTANTNDNDDNDDDDIDRAGIVRPLYIELFTFLRKRNNNSHRSEPLAQKEVQEVDTLKDGDTIQYEEADTCTQKNNIHIEEERLDKSIVEIIEVQADSIDDKLSEEIACLRDLLSTYAKTDGDQYQWHQELLSTLSMVYGSNHEITTDAMLALINWLKDRYSSMSQITESVHEIPVTSIKSDVTEGRNSAREKILQVELQTSVIQNPNNITNLYRDCIERVIRRVGSDDDRAVQVRSQLAVWYESLKKWEDAEALLQEIHATIKHIYGDGSDRAKESTETLSAYYVRSGRPDPTMIKPSKKKSQNKKM